MYMKFQIEIPKQTQVTFQEPCHLQSPDIEKKQNNMASMQPFWKWHGWKSIGFFPYSHVMCQWSWDMIFKAKLKLQSGNKKFNIAARRPFWKWRRWKSTGLFPYTQVMCYWSLALIFKDKLKLESGNWKIQYGHFESDVFETLQVLARGQKLHAYEIWNWNSKANLSYTPEKMPPTESVHKL